jgi:hypothetical protein
MGQPTGTVAVDGELVRMASPLRYEFKRDAVIVIGVDRPAGHARGAAAFYGIP